MSYEQFTKQGLLLATRDWRQAFVGKQAFTLRLSTLL